MRRAIVIFILCILGGHSYSLTPVEKAQQIRAQNDFKEIEQKLIIILSSPKSDPEKSSDKSIRRVVVANDDGSLTSIVEKAITDPWGTPYRLKRKDNEITLISAGPDKKFSLSDDISYQFTLKAEQDAAANP